MWQRLNSFEKINSKIKFNIPKIWFYREMLENQPLLPHLNVNLCRMNLIKDLGREVLTWTRPGQRPLQGGIVVGRKRLEDWRSSLRVWIIVGRKGFKDWRVCVAASLSVALSPSPGGLLEPAYIRHRSLSRYYNLKELSLRHKLNLFLSLYLRNLIM